MTVSFVVIKKNAILPWVKRVFLALALGFFLYSAWKSEGALLVTIANARIGWLLAATAGWAVLHLLSPIFVAVLLSGLGGDVDYKIALGIHVTNLPARYLPGGVWHTIGRVMDFHKLGVQPAQLTAFVLLENLLAAAVTLAVGGASVWYFRGATTWGWLGLVAAIGAMTILASIPLFITRKVSTTPIQLPLTVYLKSLAVMGLFWAIAAMIFVVYLSSFSVITHNVSYQELAGAYLFSWGIGFIAIFSPQGVGVFEAVFSMLLTDPVSLGLLPLIAGFRLVVLAADGIVWSVYTAVRKFPEFG